jgi:hypothetical protein
MKKAFLGRTAAIAAALLGAGWLVLSACSNQGEGERCELLNNSDDCQDGLVCTDTNALPEGFKTSPLCCPPERARATTEACREPAGSAVGDSAPPPDTGPPPSSDAATDADAPVGDAGPDASDASDDG